MLKLSRLRALREQAAMSMEDLADASGVARSNISRIEAGKQTARYATAKALAAALGVKPADLMADDKS